MCKHPPVDLAPLVPCYFYSTMATSVNKSTTSATKASVRIANLSGNQSPLSPASSREQSPSSGTKSKKLKKSTCPCGGSSAGKDWLFKCPECAQHWHASCSNLKGTNGLNQATVDKINKEWMCPWCWKCPFAKPGSHSSSLNENILLEKTLTCSLLQKLTDTVTESIEKSLPTQVDLSGLESKLENLSKDVQEFKSRGLDPIIYDQTPIFIESREPHSSLQPDAVPRQTLKAPVKPYDVYREQYLSQEQLESMADLLGYLKDGGDLVPENGHSVFQYGEPYGYTGSKSLQEFSQIPPELNSIIEKLTADLSLEHRPNSVLINYYPPFDRLDRNESHLPKHSDDESTILADSKIITISIGATRKVLFEAKHDDGEKPVVLEPQSNSVYVMSRSSQNWFYHSILRPEENESVEERFSITFRSLSQKFRRSIMLMGDSNTKEIKFGEGSGTVGASYPGKREKAARVKDIDPVKCVGYQNIFLHCGTNDLRCTEIISDNQIYELVNTLHGKLALIKQLCPKAKIFVVPVLPSRISAMNRNIMMYNNLAAKMLAKSFPSISFRGVYGFLDNYGLLKSKLTRNNDTIHLGPRGISLYVSLMKQYVFQTVKIEQFNKPKTGVSTSHRSAEDLVT